MAKQQPESKLANSIISALKFEFGGLWFKQYSGPKYNAVPGIPDIHGTLLGQSCWLEVKRPETRTKLADSQKKMLARLNEPDVAAICGVVCSPGEAIDLVRAGMAQRGFIISETGFQIVRDE